MKSPRFILTRLVLIGEEVPAAEVVFAPGLNVVSGPSDTGKTFIVQCIDYAMGAGSLPKPIDAATPYDTVQLGIRRGEDDDEVFLERSLRGGDVRLRTHGHDDIVLAAKHRAGDANTVSSFLLELCGLDDRRVRTNKSGKTRPLSFRDLARLVLVDEQAIFSEESPVHSGQFVNKTVESSVFRLLLTGTDDDSVVSVEPRAAARAQTEGKEELLDLLIRQTKAKIDDLALARDERSLRQEMERLKAAMDSAEGEVAKQQEIVSDLERQRRQAWTQSRKAESRSSVLRELLGRFALLKDQYTSDLLRLEAIGQAGDLLCHFVEERCPICGASSEHHDSEHQSPRHSPSDVATACEAEAAKIRILLADLSATVESTHAENHSVGQALAEAQGVLSASEASLMDNLRPRLRGAVEALRENRLLNDALAVALGHHERLHEFNEMLREVAESDEPQPRGHDFPSMGSREVEGFSQEVEVILREWGFPILGRVTFSEEDEDLIIGGSRRGSHGKGVRAITHAAFNLALLKYCTGRGMPHPGLVLLDSPLVVYREPDADSAEITQQLKDTFYRAISSTFFRDQVVVIENEDPPRDIEESANIIRFTGADHGRRGFIPNPE